MKQNYVLFLDDDDLILNAVKRTFADEPYGVLVANNAAEAMDILARENIKVVLSDQRMPDVTGIQFLYQVGERYPDIIRILFTAYADLSAAEGAINIVKVYRYINKPWHPDELKHNVAVALEHFDVIRENKRLFEDTCLKNEELNLANCKLKTLYDIQKDFSSTLSHELRTPLASIKAAIDIVMSGTAGDLTEHQKNFLGKAKDNVDRLNRLINNILDLAHMESGKTALSKQPGDFNKAMQSVVEAQESVAKSKGLYLKAMLDDRIPSVSFDWDKLVQVLNNLIANALKFTTTGGITVTSGLALEERRINISVQDTGCGIKEEDLVKLFEKFQQLGEAHQKCAGTGLGLAICREIIRQHGGKIKVDSKPGEGSCFSFWLPLDEKEDINGKP